MLAALPAPGLRAPPGVTGKALRRQPLAAAGAAAGDDLAAAFGRHARAEPVPTLSHEAGGLVGALQGGGSRALGAGERAAIGERPGKVNASAAAAGWSLVLAR